MSHGTKQSLSLIQRKRRPVLIIDPLSLAILEINPACTKMLGVTAKQCLGRSMLRWMDHSDHADIRAVMKLSDRFSGKKSFQSHWVAAEAQKLKVNLDVEVLRLSDHHQLFKVSASKIQK